MSENAAMVARSVEHNTGSPNRETIAREHIGTIAGHHSQFDGDLDAAIAEADTEGFIEEVDSEYRAIEKVWEIVPGTARE